MEEGVKDLGERHTTVSREVLVKGESAIRVDGDHASNEVLNRQVRFVSVWL